MALDIVTNQERRILIVDDDKDFAESLHDVLEPEGYIIETVCDADTAREKLAHFDPHVALLDVRLDSGSGIDLLHMLREKSPDTICIMLTAYANIESAIESMRIGAYDYLRKPIRPEELLATLRRSFDVFRLTQEKAFAEKALLESEQRFRGLVNNIPGVIYRAAKDKCRTIHFISGAIADISGYPATDFIETNVRSYASIIHRDDISLIQFDIQSAVEMHEPYVLEYRVINANGQIRWVYEKGQGVFDDNGEVSWLDGAIFDITESHELSEQLSYYASHDVLTALINRREFEYRLQRVLETAREEQSEHALCYMDLDQFKVINDTCGHVAGDELLRQLGDLLQGKVRKRDTLARLGGDEFGVLMEHCSLQQARRVANKLRQAIEGFRFAWEDRSFSIGVSIGLVPITATSLSTIELMKQADAACYAAKDAGRNRIHTYHEADTELARRYGEMQWVAQINRALEEDRFSFYVQPIVPVKGRKRIGDHYEVLLRMRDEKGRLIPPGAFLPAAERYNLSPRLDRWVIDNFFQWLLDNPLHLKRLFQCSINLSGLSLGDEQFLPYLVERFTETQIDPGKVCFEITETAAIANLSSATVFIKTLKELGCWFALDDFGSGLSSFAYLKTLPVDYLKIDGVFVKDIDTDPIDLAMVRSINDIGKVMGKQTIAEFVESKAILMKLREIDVDFAQGYYIGKPVKLDEPLIADAKIM